MKLSGFEVYKTYLAMKQHFTNKNYNYKMYAGHVNASVASYESRKDKWIFSVLSKRHSADDIRDLIIAAFVDDKAVYPHKLLSDECKELLTEYKRKKESLSYIFRNDLAELLNDVENPNDILRVKEGNPIILSKLYAGEITIETLIILNKILNFFPMFDKKLAEDYLWKETKEKCDKYSTFLELNIDKFEEIVKAKLNGKL